MKTQQPALRPLIEALYEELSLPIPDRTVVGQALQRLLQHPAAPAPPPESEPVQAAAIPPALAESVHDWLQRLAAEQDFEQEAMDVLKIWLQQHAPPPDAHSAAAALPTLLDTQAQASNHIFHH